VSALAPAVLVLADGTVFRGRSVGAPGLSAGEVVFNTGMVGYPETLTDPSYAGQILVLTYPLIGNYGVSGEDDESDRGWAEAFVVREMSSIPSNRRADRSLPDWLRDKGIVAIEGVDTRRITKAIRTEGCLRCVISTTDSDSESLVAKARAMPATDGRDLASVVSTQQPFAWDQAYDPSYPTLLEGLPKGERRLRCVAIDFGAKRNILRCLAQQGCKVTVVPGDTKAEDILAMNPDGVFLSNGPGDPAATGEYAVPEIRKLVDSGKPVFGICLGHQMLALALGGKTVKMHQGHHGANHPVKDHTTGKVEITSMNHGFAVDVKSLPANVEETHVSLFDGSNCGIALKDRPVFSVQYHPEASPGPRDSHYLFTRLVDLMRDSKRA